MLTAIFRENRTET